MGLYLFVTSLKTCHKWPHSTSSKCYLDPRPLGFLLWGEPPIFDVGCHLIRTRFDSQQQGLVCPHTWQCPSILWKTNVRWKKFIVASSLRSKHFCGVWEQKKTEERIFGVLPARKIGRETKKRGWRVGEGSEGRKRLQTNPGFWKTATLRLTPECAQWDIMLSLAFINQPIKSSSFRSGSDLSRTRAEPKQTLVKICPKQRAEKSRWIRATDAGFVIVILKLNLAI